MQSWDRPYVPMYSRSSAARTWIGLIPREQGTVIAMGRSSCTVRPVLWNVNLICDWPDFGTVMPRLLTSTFTTHVSASNNVL